ncbi:hypothetical protein CKO15_01260 [Halorhodospira abdelmalekii]|uniref:hypothetical protein n=1 Tax=Halorhodospira abdelmalekii TaxID=421629 RepID=UPI0019052AAE|nr:hypothetical protein [Halorhodospira abdelmalekii]MBK1733929.1 hypothetical protein [Halorhodospira abdelmalekii]
MVTTTIGAIATVLSLLLMIAAGTFEARAQRLGKRLDAESARDIKYWQRGAASLFAIATLPGLISRPAPEFAAAVHDALSALSPMFLLLGALCFIASASKILPAWRRYREQRAQDAQKQRLAELGDPFPEVSAAIAQSLEQCLPGMTVKRDVRDGDGHHASLLLEPNGEGEAEGRYIIYALPRVNLFKGEGKEKGKDRGNAAQRQGTNRATEAADGSHVNLNLNAVSRAAKAASAFEGRPLLWTPAQGNPTGYYAPVDWEMRPYVVEGKDIHLAEAIKKFELAGRSERRRREAREAARKAEEGDPRHHLPVRTEITADKARAAASDRDGWERFNRLAPRHPHMIEVIRRRARNICDLCTQTIIPEESGKIAVTDHEHVCKNDATVRIALNEGPEPVSQNMPDCAQCHYEYPELYESCVSRLTTTHSGKCPDPQKNAERDAELDHREKLARLAGH